MNNSISILNAGTIEIHYWLNDGSHTMDADVFNRCEYELLGILNEISAKLKLQIKVEVEPIEEGGIRAWLKLNCPSTKSIKDTLLFQIFLGVFINVVSIPVTQTLSKLYDKVIDQVFEDPEILVLEKERDKAKLENEIATYKLDTKRKCENLDENKIKKKKSNYYAKAKECRKLEKISFSITDSQKQHAFKTVDVIQSDFEKFIMASDELEPEENENAIIEIISPVLKQGKYKWHGIYEGETIQFNMKSSEFKKMVLDGKVSFQNGSAIVCRLITKKKVNAEGDVKVSGYDVLEVFNIIINDVKTETPEGKRKRQNKEAENKQLSLFPESLF